MIPTNPRNLSFLPAIEESPERDVPSFPHNKFPQFSFVSIKLHLMLQVTKNCSVPIGDKRD